MQGYTKTPLRDLIK